MKSPCRKRRGLALILALAALALAGALLSAGAARAYGLKAEQKRANRQARLRLAVWDAVWSRLRVAAARPEGPEAGETTFPDGVQTAVKVEKLKSARRDDPVRFAIGVTARWERDRREAWSLVEPQGAAGYRILTWVER
ncbi:MAG: hypothetical protein R6X19_03280 [Kiritimatiellia bacterium]